MRLIDAFVHNPVKVSVGVLLAVLFGVVAVVQMPMQLTPEVQRPTISIFTLWPGASPQEVEREIVVEQEEQLKGVEGVIKMTSQSSDSRGEITLEFQVGTNMEEALLKVNSRLSQVPTYPEDADEPVLSTSSSSENPIAWFILSSRRPSTQEVVDFQKRHPELASELEPVLGARTPELATVQLLALAQKRPQLKELLPPEDQVVIELRRFAEDEIEARFERVPGVSQSNVFGGLEDELQVVVDPEKLAARQLTLTDVRNVLRFQNQDTSAGDFWEGKRRWVVRTLGQFRSPEQVEKQLLAVRDGAPVFVRDVATVRLGYKKPNGLVRNFGESTIAINCMRESGANVLDVMEGLRRTAKDIDEKILRPRRLQLTQVYDETEYIDASIKLVQQNIFIGGSLTMIVLMLFLHVGTRTLVTAPLIVVTALAAAYISPWYSALGLAIILVAGFWFARGALVVGLAIPTSIVATFLVLRVLGRSLNVVSLAGLAFAVGMLVDNAVVVLENVYRRYRMGEAPFAAAVKGTQEVWGAVAASTLTTVAVFLPVVFVQEEAGQLFRDIALAISAAVALSLLVSMTVIPTASARLFGGDRDGKRPFQRTPPLFLRLFPAFNGRRRQRSSKASEVARPQSPRSSQRQAGQISQPHLRPIYWGAEAFVKLVVNVNRWIQRGTVRRIALVVLLVGLAIGGSWLLWPQVEYLPTGNRNLVFGIMMPPPGYNLGRLMELGETVESSLWPYWDVDPDSPEAEQLDYPVIRDFFFVAWGRQAFMGLVAHDPQRAGELVPLVQKIGAEIPGTIAVAYQTSLFAQGLAAGRTIDIEITGPQLSRLVQLGGQVMGRVGQIMPTAQARPIPSLDLSTPELHIEPKLLQAADMGVSSSDLGFVANALVDGAYAGDYFLDGKKVDLTILGEQRFADTTHEIGALPVATPIGQLVPLAALADVSLASGPEQVNHRERVRAITVEVSPPVAMALEDAMGKIQDQIVQPMVADGQLQGGYQINLAGTADKLRGTWRALRFNLVLALVITYLLMAALFESWLYPLVIILSVPLGAVGGILGLNLLNLFVLQPLDVLTMLGFVILIGTVVNNPILIVHQSLNHMREEGASPGVAILESVRTRIRPILMTTMTTVLGLLPLVLFPGAGSELYRGLGSVVLGGLLVSTVFTLVLVPTLFSLMMDAKHFVVRLVLGERVPVTEPDVATPRPDPAHVS